ncbi:MAG: heat-inducible transcriptional repressor HrcA [Cyanobacteria bacterium SBLK]|nr:heat-inducible transcriptional repressor HrcA [Cyanobacteria bacterium SBLK]
MSSSFELSDRHQSVLWATIRHYVATAEPVGSKTLAQEYNFQVSPATIRNAMGRLEKEGFLYQPHTSAGRIPSDSGYRIYVDRLMSPDDMGNEQIIDLYTQQLDWNTYNLEVLLKRATQILATLSGHIALITLPQNPRDCLRHLQLVPVSEKQVMLVVVMEGYQTQSILMDLAIAESEDREDSEEFIAEELQILSNFLNHKLRGKSLSDLSSIDWVELDREFQCYADILKTSLVELEKCLHQPAYTPILIRGISEALRQPEFARVSQIQTLLHLLEEEQDQLFPLIFETPESEDDNKRASVRIGSENSLEPLNICTLISARYHQGDIPVGSVGLIGPTRMLYENAIALVEASADYLSEALS